MTEPEHWNEFMLRGPDEKKISKRLFELTNEGKSTDDTIDTISKEFDMGHWGKIGLYRTLTLVEQAEKLFCHKCSNWYKKSEERKDWWKCSLCGERNEGCKEANDENMDIQKNTKTSPVCDGNGN